MNISGATAVYGEGGSSDCEGASRLISISVTSHGHSAHMDAFTIGMLWTIHVAFAQAVGMFLSDGEWMVLTDFFWRRVSRWYTNENGLWLAERW